MPNTVVSVSEPRRASLGPVLDLAAAAPLRALLMAHRGADLDVDASAVERMGGLCLQVLLAGRQAWALDRLALRLVDVSEPCRSALRLARAEAALGLEG